MRADRVRAAVRRAMRAQRLRLARAALRLLERAGDARGLVHIRLDLKQWIREQE